MFEILIICPSNKPDSTYNKYSEIKEIIIFFIGTLFTETFITNDENNGELLTNLCKLKKNFYDIIIFSGCNLIESLFVKYNSEKNKINNKYYITGITNLSLILKIKGKIIIMEGRKYIDKLINNKHYEKHSLTLYLEQITFMNNTNINFYTNIKKININNVKQNIFIHWNTKFNKHISFNNKSYKINIPNRSYPEYLFYTKKTNILFGNFIKNSKLYT